MESLFLLFLEDFTFRCKEVFGLLAKMEAQVDTLCHLTQPKEGKQQILKQKTPELTENQTVWKSNNQAVKKKHSSRLVGGADVGSQVERTCSKAAAGGQGVGKFTHIKKKKKEQPSKR